MTKYLPTAPQVAQQLIATAIVMVAIHFLRAKFPRFKAMTTQKDS